MTPSTVRDKLKLALNITGLRVFDTIPENIVPPAAVVGQLSLEWDLVMARGADTATVDIFVVAGRMSDRSAQDYLDSLLTATGANSIKTKIAARMAESAIRPPTGGVSQSFVCALVSPMSKGTTAAVKTATTNAQKPA